VYTANYSHSVAAQLDKLMSGWALLKQDGISVV